MTGIHPHQTGIILNNDIFHCYQDYRNDATLGQKYNCVFKFEAFFTAAIIENVKYVSDVYMEKKAQRPR